YGWFIDPTPGNASEFAPGAKNSPAAGHVDLLTVVAHEIGHVFGIFELANPTDVMFQDLALGVRKLPGAADVVAILGLDSGKNLPTPAAGHFTLDSTTQPRANGKALNSNSLLVNALGKNSDGIGGNLGTGEHGRDL